MQNELQQFIASKFDVPVVEGEDKVCSLTDAIRRHVRKNMSINLQLPGALMYQLIREFWDRDAGFEVIVQSMNHQLLAMLKGGITRKLLTSFAGNSYPSPGPNPVVQQAYLSGTLQIENWTMRTINQRLLAGAMGWDFIPTRSLLGSSMETDNADSFKTMPEPFGGEGTIGMLKALNPDIALVHGVVADRSGNTILTYPLGGDAFGAWAAKEGAIVSVEKIVSTDFIRRHSHMVRIPAYMVKAVCVAPFGAHPSGLTCHGLPEFDAYFPDYDFQIDERQACRDEESHYRWIREWVLDCPDHQSYLAKVGNQRLLYLKGKGRPDAWKSEIDTMAQAVDFTKPANTLERLVIAGGRVIAERCAFQGFKTMLAGIGLTNLAAWLAADFLKEKGQVVDLTAEMGLYGYLPRASDPNVFSFHNNHNCKLLTNIDTTLGVFVGGHNNRCLGVLGAGQIDPYGNANSTMIPGQTYLVGSGGANDIATTNVETVVVMNSGRKRLVPEVPYITYPGKNVRTLVTDIGVFEKVDGKKTFTLTACVPSHPEQSEAECVAAARERVGWDLDIAATLGRLDPPDETELKLVRLFDPMGYFIGKG